ncbi:hypothetical protein D3C75_911790 [compost metagenome]
MGNRSFRNLNLHHLPRNRGRHLNYSFIILDLHHNLVLFQLVSGLNMPFYNFTLVEAFPQLREPVIKQRHCYALLPRNRELY